VIVDPGGRDIRMAEPFLHLGDIGLVIERIGRGGGPQRVRANFKTEPAGIRPHQLIDAVRRDAFALRS
jgi:hypothetical protein